MSTSNATPDAGEGPPSRLERFVDSRIWGSRAVTILVGPTLRLGIARRDLANQDTGAIYAQVGVRGWSSGGVFAAARIAVALDDPSSTPSVGAAGGVGSMVARPNGARLRP